MSRRRRRSRRGSSGQAGTIFGIIVALILLAGLIAGGIYIYLNQEKTLTLNKDFCPSQGPTHTVAILLDTTETIAEATQISARKKIQQEIMALPRYAKLEIFNVDGQGLSNSIGSVCNPGKKEDLSAYGQQGIVANPALVEKRYGEFVEEAVNALNIIMNKNFEAEQSPLLQALQMMSLRFNPPKDYPNMNIEAKRNKVIFITDFLENTEFFSVYRTGPDLDAFEKSRSIEKFGNDLRDIDIEIWLVKRNKDFATTQEVKQFWSTVFKRFLKSDINRIIELPGEL